MRDASDQPAFNRNRLKAEKLIERSGDDFRKVTCSAAGCLPDLLAAAEGIALPWFSRRIAVRVVLEFEAETGCGFVDEAVLRNGCAIEQDLFGADLRLAWKPRFYNATMRTKDAIVAIWTCRIPL